MHSDAPFEQIVTKFCTWDWVGDVITDAKFYGNRLRGLGVTEPPKRYFLYLTFIALTCCTVIFDDTAPALAYVKLNASDQ